MRSLKGKTLGKSNKGIATLVPENELSDVHCLQRFLNAFRSVDIVPNLDYNWIINLNIRGKTMETLWRKAIGPEVLVW